MDCRDVASNIFLGREPLKARFFVDKKRMNRESEELLRKLKVSIPSVTTPVEFLSGGQRQGIAVARSINQQGKMIIFDEPTAAMGVGESARVLKLIRSLGDEGFAVLIISHNLHHVFPYLTGFVFSETDGWSRTFAQKTPTPIKWSVLSPAPTSGLKNSGKEAQKA